MQLLIHVFCSDVISGEGATFEVNYEDFESEDRDSIPYTPAEVLDYTNPSCCGLIEEDTYQDEEPFESIAHKMFNLLPDGAVKKRILREGYGDALPDNGLVTIHYNAYLEYNDEPFDSTYMRRKPLTFQLKKGNTIPGLDIGVQSMKINEKSQFLIVPEYAYGKLGCLQRIPPNSTVLFEVELKNCIDSQGSKAYDILSKEKQNDFGEIYKYAHALCAKANNLYTKQLYKLAIKEYNIASSKLETCQLKHYAEQEKQQSLLLRLYTNLIVCYTKIQEPKRACTNCNKVYRMCKDTSLKVPAKVYFNHARSLILLSDYDEAENKLKQARFLEPQNVEITKEFLKLDAKKKENYIREKALAKAVFKNIAELKVTASNSEVTDLFRESISSFCKELWNDSDATQYNLPDKLTTNELTFCKKEVLKNKLLFKHYKVGEEDKYCISKPSSIDE